MNSPRQAILQFIRTFAAQHGYPPTYREIGRGCHLSTSAAFYWVNKLKREGLVNKFAGRMRTIRVIEG